MISAIPALSSAPSSVVPSLVTMSWPTRSASAGSCVGIEHLSRIARELDRLAAPAPRGRSATTPAPTTSGVVSTCAMSPTAGAATVPGKRREDRSAVRSARASERPISRSSSTSIRERSSCFSVLGRSLDAVRRLRVDADVAEEALEHVVCELLGERARERGSSRQAAPSLRNVLAHRLDPERRARRRGRSRSASARCTRSRCRSPSASVGSPAGRGPRRSGACRRAHEQRTCADDAARTRRRRARSPARRHRRESGLGADCELDLELRAVAAAPRGRAARTPRGSRPGPGQERGGSRRSPAPRPGSTVFTRSGEPPAMPVHVERRARRRCGGRTPPRRPGRSATRPAARAARPRRAAAPRPRAPRPTAASTPTRSASGSATVSRGSDARERRHESVSRVERRSPRTSPSACRVVAGADVRGGNRASRGRRRRTSGRSTPRPSRRRRSARRPRRARPARPTGRSSRRRPPPRRRSAKRTLTGSSPAARELSRGLDEHEEVPLVVGDPARVEPAVALQ